MRLKSIIQQNFILLPGWKTKRKIIVIESDDWGTIRMPDLETYNILLKQNPKLISDSMSRLDSLESNSDLLSLFDVLESVKDSNGRNAVITANTIVANPDFDKIYKNGFEEYHYEKFTQTLKRYPHRDQVETLIKEGIEKGIYKPQFHGREHLNVAQWLTALQNGHLELSEAFKYRLFGLHLTQKASKRNNLMSAFDFDTIEEREQKKKIVHDGMSIFEEIFGFRSRSFIATTYIWDSGIERVLNEGGVSYIQGIPYQYIPNPGGKKYKRKFHYTGQENTNNQIYLVRNAFFEPSLAPKKDNVNDCLNRIELAFKWGKPAIIGSHRLNFIGSISENNRTDNLRLLKHLLNSIIMRWPDVEFMSSDQLGDLILMEK